ncbi:uncharacterized protein LOC131149286 [Malania oleifera]|uniref:uncharacterized protein LOC131149286 n=1 Tax=Malania oleifera TaxID=397392 RepID=UPI0025AEAB4C|nr:uncharacterized protein LOC131149286 [Malania oleifera]
MYKKKQLAKESSSRSNMDLKDQEMDMKRIMKDIEYLGASNMTWKERKELENKKVVSLGGKPPKKHRLPLSVARVAMKKQKEREQKLLQESLVLRRFGGKFGGGSKGEAEKRKPEGRVLKSSEGYFRSGVLDVKHLLQPSSSTHVDSHISEAKKGQRKKGKGKKNKGKKQRGGRKRH